MSNTGDTGQPNEVGDVLDRLRRLADDLQAQAVASRTDGLAGERWLARLTSIETRLEMVESSMRAETERMRAAAGALDGAAGDIRSALSGANSVIDIATTLGDRVTELESLLTRAGALDAEAISEVAIALGAPLFRAVDEQTSKIAERERLSAEALDRLTTQLNEFTGALAEEVRRAGTDQASRVQEVVANLEANLAPLRVAIDELGTRPDGAERQEALHAIVVGLAARPDPVGRLDAFGAALAQLASRPDPNARLDAVASGLADIANRPDTAAEVGVRLDALGAALESRLAELATRTPPGGEMHGRLDGIAASVEGLSTVQHRIAGVLEELRALADRPDDESVLASRLDATRADIGALAAAQQRALNDISEGVQQQLARLAGLDALDNRLGAVTELIDDLGARPDMAAALTPALDRLAAVGDGVSALHADLDGVATALGAVRGELNQSGAAIANRLDALQAPDSRLNLELDRIAADLSTLVVSVPAVGERTDAILRGLSTLAAETPSLESEFAPVRAALDDLANRLAAIDRTTVDNASRLAATASMQDGLARLEAATADVRGRLAGLADLPAMLTDLSVASGGTAARLDELAATPPAVTTADLEQLVRRIVDVVADARDELLARATTTSTAATPDDVEAASARNTERVTAELEAVRGSLASLMHDRLGSIDAGVPMAVEAAVGSALPPLVERLVTRIDSTAARIFEGMASGDGDARAGFGRMDSMVGELRTEVELVRRTVEGLTALRALASRPDLTPEIARLAGDVAATRVELGELLAALDSIRERLTPIVGPGDIDAVGDQLDALGQLVHHALRSLHVLEVSTVGETARGQKSRAAVAAALDQLRTARRR